jgi:PAS domain-containing protein
MERVLNQHLETIRSCCIDDAAFEQVKQIINDQLSIARQEKQRPNSAPQRSPQSHKLTHNHTHNHTHSHRHNPPTANADLARSRALLDAIPDLLFRFNRQGIYTDVLGKARGGSSSTRHRINW